MNLLTNIKQHSGKPQKFLKTSVLEFKSASNQRRLRLSRGMGSRFIPRMLSGSAPSSEALGAGYRQPWYTLLNVAKAGFTMVIPALFSAFLGKGGAISFFSSIFFFFALHVQINDTINGGMCFGSCYQER